HGNTSQSNLDHRRIWSDRPRPSPELRNHTSNPPDPREVLVRVRPLLPIPIPPPGSAPGEKIAILDWNNDEELAFGEYWRLIRELARAITRP
uniref:Uncharacterized protein n=1 Tax=Malurus cyaneus samueli TaxID=2593467 RepID=A0A8C5U2G2_9PASS